MDDFLARKTERGGTWALASSLKAMMRTLVFDPGLPNPDAIPPEHFRCQDKHPGFCVTRDRADEERIRKLQSLLHSWGKAVEVIALASDPFSVNPKAEPSDPSHYWRGTVPQLLVLDGQGKVLYDVDGVMESAEIEAALSKATGIELTIEERSSINFNEINSGYSS